MRWLWRSLVEETVGHLWTTFAIPVLAPLSAAAITAFLGWIAQPSIPWMYIWATAIFVLAMSSAAIVWLMQIADIYRVKDKFNFHQIRFLRGSDQPGFGLGVSMISSAQFPIEFQLDSCRTEINNTLPKERKHPKALYKVPPRGWGFLDDYLIELADVPRPGTLEGFAEFKVKYGKIGAALKHHLSIKKQVVLQFDESGHLTGGIWNDAIE